MIKRFLIIMLLLSAVVSVAVAQDSMPAPEAEGVSVINGELAYTFGFFNTLWRDPYVILYDAAGVIDVDWDFVPAMESQEFGLFTSDVTESPISYEIKLPAVPEGEFRDVDNDDTEDTGVQVFLLGIFNNLWGDPFMDERDDFYFSYPSARISDDAATLGRVTGGKVLVWSPDAEQGFPSAFGEDGLAFTEDDPSTTLEAGWTLVDMETEPFTFVRDAVATADLLEPESAEQDDFSDLSYTEAFNAMIDLLAEEYAFTELKEIDWEAKRAQFLPRMEEAEANEDEAAYRRVLRDFAWSIPDGHMFGPVDFAEFQQATAGGIGIAIRELDGGRIVVNYVTEGSPADEAGIELGTEIIEINGEPALQAVGAVIPWSAPFSTIHVLRLQQLRYVTRAPIGEEIELTYQLPGASDPVTETFTFVDEIESFRFSSFNAGLSGTEYPVEFEILDSGYGYVKIYSFSDDLPLTVELWDRAMQTFIANGVPGVIVDMRQNGGGYTSVGYQMVSYFFDEDYVIEIDGFYDDSIGGTFIFEESPSRFTPPVPELQYDGDVVVLIAPSCSSACEYVSRAMTLNNRAEAVGFYPTNGIGGGWQPFLMPDGVQMPKIISTAYDEDLNLIIESRPVQPTERVPVTEETLFAEGDVLLDRAVELLGEMATFETEEITALEIGETVPGQFEEGVRDTYTLEVTQGDSFVVDLKSPPGVDPVLRVYVEGDPEPVAINDNAAEGTRSAQIEILDVPADFTFVIEATTVRDAGDGAYLLSIVAPGEAAAAGEEAAATEEATATEEADATEEAAATEEANE